MRRPLAKESWFCLTSFLSLWPSNAWSPRAVVAPPPALPTRILLVLWAYVSCSETGLVYRASV